MKKGQTIKCEFARDSPIKKVNILDTTFQLELARLDSPLIPEITTAPKNKLQTSVIFHFEEEG